ncbi:hypothetical protein BHE74_00053240, partial [Ensete ventricosum]
DAKAVGSCRCYLEVLEQDARAGDGGCCYLLAWEQDAKMVGYHSYHLDCDKMVLALDPLFDVLQLSEKGRASGHKFKWLRGLLATAEAGSVAVGSNKSSRSGLGSPTLMLRLLPRLVCRGRGCRRGGLGGISTVDVYSDALPITANSITPRSRAIILHDKVNVRNQSLPIYTTLLSMRDKIGVVYFETTRSYRNYSINTRNLIYDSTHCERGL